MYVTELSILKEPKKKPLQIKLLMFFGGSVFLGCELVVLWYLLHYLS